MPFSPSCKFLLRSLSALPIISPKHLQAIERSRKSLKDRLSTRLWRAQRDYKHAAKLSRMVEDNIRAFEDLSTREKKMVEDYDCGRGLVKELKSLLTEHFERPAEYRGAGVILWLPSNPEV